VDLADQIAEVLAGAIVRAVQRPEVAAALRAIVGPVPPAEEPDALLAKGALAKRLDVSPSTVDRLTREGMPVASYVGDARRYDVAACRAWLAARGRKPTRAAKPANEVDVDDVLAANGLRAAR
jgi:hypothetical protein